MKKTVAFFAIWSLLQYITGVWAEGKPIELFYSDTVPSIVG